MTLTLGVVVTTFIIRSLSLKEYGTYTVLLSLLGYVSVLASFGLADIFRRFIPEALEQQNYGLLKKLIVGGLIVRALLSVACVGLVLLLHVPIGNVLKVDELLTHLHVLSFGIVVYLEANLLSSVLHSLFLHKYSVIASTIYSVVRGGLIFLLIGARWGIQGILAAEAVAWMFWGLLQWFFYHRKFHRRHKTNVDADLPMRRYFRYGAFSSLNEFGSAVLGSSTDYLIITAFLGPAAVALYAFAERVVRLIVNCMPHVVLVDVIRPSFFTKYAQTGDKSQLNEMFNLLVKLGAFCIFPLAGALLAMGDKVIEFVFKADYLPAEAYLWILVLFTAINVFATPTGLVLQAVEQVQINLYSKWFAVLNVAVSLVVVQPFEVTGVLLSTCVCGFLKNVYCFVYAKRYAHLRSDWRGLTRILVNTCVMGIALALMRAWAASALTLLLTLLGGAAVFFAASVLNKAFTERERAMLNKVAPKRIFVF